MDIIYSKFTHLQYITELLRGLTKIKVCKHHTHIHAKKIPQPVLAMLAYAVGFGLLNCQYHQCEAMHGTLFIFN